MENTLKLSPVIPVLVINKSEHAIPIIRAILNGGLKVLEITLRTSAALEVIKMVKENIPDAIVAAGTVVNRKQMDAVMNAGAAFAVSPGFSIDLIEHSIENDFPLLPGVATPSEVIQVMERGLRHMKFFPAEAAGGINMLKSIAGPFPQARFCPTGGINEVNAVDYLAMDNVICVGGTWIAPENLQEDKNWREIEQRARNSAALR